MKCIPIHEAASLHVQWKAEREKGRHNHKKESPRERREIEQRDDEIDEIAKVVGGFEEALKEKKGGWIPIPTSISYV